MVVVGDSKQLPPTSFFDRLVNAEEIDEESLTADLESVLGLFSAQGAPERMLRWHYRSRHESLITVSNHEFYEDRLVVFPSPDKGREDVGLVYHHLPDTVYDRGGSAQQRRRGEAGGAGRDGAREEPPAPHPRASPRSASAQMQAIEDQLEILRRADPSCEDFFTSHPYEPFFVKNLENVQGDERDVMFISVGYGRTAGGYVPMCFGPLNLGRRRAAAERAHHPRPQGLRGLHEPDRRRHRPGPVQRPRRAGPQDVPPVRRRTASWTCQLPRAASPTRPSRSPCSPPCRAPGYQVETQVGSAGFFIDLAVVDPERPGRYLLGIECDGATYHSARSARDRDRLRQEVLERLWLAHPPHLEHGLVQEPRWGAQALGGINRGGQALRRTASGERAEQQGQHYRHSTRRALVFGRNCHPPQVRDSGHPNNLPR